MLQTAKIVNCAAVIALACVVMSCSRKSSTIIDDFPPPSLVAITVTPASVSLVQDTTLQLIVKGKYSDQTSRDLRSGLSWTSSATDVATVSSAGLVTGVKVGQAALTVTSGIFVATALIQVVPVALQTINVKPLDSSVLVNGQQPFAATGTFNNGTLRDLTPEVTWSSSDATIAAIDNTGLATGRAEGTVIISATSGSVTGTTTFTVNGVTLAVINITPKSLALVMGTKQSLVATGTYSDGHTEVLTSGVTWSSDSAAATVDIRGEVTAVATGTAHISANFQNKTQRATVVVVNAQPTSLTVTPLNPTVVTGSTQRFTATLAFNNGTRQDITSQASWTSSPLAVAFAENEEGKKGIVRATGSGKATITATFGGKAGSTELTVVAGILQSLSVTPSSGSIPLGTTQQFKAEGIYDIGLRLDLTASVTWTSSNLSVAATSTSGLVTGSSVGTATITATSGAISGTASLTVTNAILSSLFITPLSPLIFIDNEQTFTALGVFSDGATHDLTKDVRWESDNLNIATIDVAGDATGVGAGECIIKATFNGKSGTTTLTVKPATLVSMAIFPSDPIIPPGIPQPLLAIGTYSDGSSKNLTSTVSWSSFPPNIAHVDNSEGSRGVVTGLIPGTTVIQAIQKSTVGTTNLTITGATLTGVSVTPKSSSIPAGIRLQYTATGQLSDGSTRDITSSVVWKTADRLLATVDEFGVAQAVAPGGPIAIEATYLEKTGTATLTVNNAAITSLSVTPASSILGVGFTRQYTATAGYNDGSSYDVTRDTVFTSGDVPKGSILAVTSTGLATGVSVGTTNINASFGGMPGSTPVDVRELSLTAINVTPVDSSVPRGGTLQYKAMGEYGGGFKEDLTGVVSWASQNSAVAVIAGNTGLATGVAIGDTEIRAIFGAIIGTTTLRVGGEAAKEVTAGGDHTCAVRTDSSLSCWGKNFSGQIGRGNSNNVLLAESVILPSSTVVESAVGGAHTCSRMKNGSALCWGSNQKGQLGDGTHDDRSLPNPVPNLAGVRALAAGLSHTCAILSNNVVQCWGDNVSGQLGNNSNVGTSTPVSVTLTLIPSAITAGRAHTCVLYGTDGSVECWGDNGSGQLGNGSNGTSTVPVRVVNLGGVATAITAGGNHTCAILSSGTVRCWGDNGSGQLGDGSNMTRPQPVTVSSLSNVTAVLAGGSHTCALVNAQVKCWGENGTGQLGDGTLIDRNTPVDVSGFFPGEVVLDLGMGGLHACALIQGGEVRCWGANKFGQLGLEKNPISSIPVDIPGIVAASDLSGGHLHTCVVLNSGGVKCMGDNRSGQLGDGSRVSTDLAVDVSGISTATSTALGNHHTCALLTSGQVQCWGENISGQLGNGTFTASTTPVFSTGITTADAISAGDGHSCAHLQNGTIHCWGSNDRGQLGNATPTNSNLPFPVTNITTATAVSAGHRHTCALISGGTAQCWGDNAKGQLGNGNAAMTESFFPVSVTSLLNVIAISAGGSHTCALISGGTVKCWGFNDVGQLGNGTFTNSPSPVAVSGLQMAVTAISAGEAHTCALLSNNTIQCWGKNDRGQLGIGNTTSVNQPGVVVSGISTAAAIDAGASHTCARLQNGTAQCWGDAFFGQLGGSHSIEIHTTASRVHGI